MRLSEKYKYYVAFGSSSIILGTYLGFRFKELSNYPILQRAAKAKAKWQYDAIIDARTSNDSFFTLSKYDFN